MINDHPLMSDRAMSTQDVKVGRVQSRRSLPALLVRLRSWLLRRLWYVHPGQTLLVALPPGLCMRVLGTTARPHAGRLEFRHLFTGGRRYHLYHLPAGFAVMTTSKVLWHYRRRTAANAVLLGKFEEVEPQLTRIHLRGRIKLAHLLSSFLLPGFITSMIVLMPWHPAFIAAAVLALFGLSWAAHRLTAALEVYEMVYFVEKAFTAHLPPPVPGLAEGGTIAGAAPDPTFTEAWEKFYQAHRYND